MPEVTWSPKEVVTVSVDSGETVVLDSALLGYEVSRRSFRIVHQDDAAPDGNLVVEGSLEETTWVTIASLGAGEHVLIDATVVPWPYLRLRKVAGHDAVASVVGKHIDARYS